MVAPDERIADVAEKTGSFADGTFTAAAERVLATHPDDETGRMLHAPVLRTAGRFYGFAAATDLVVKLPASRVQDLISSGRGLPCSPRPGRPMREWVQLPAPDDESCVAYLLEARAFVVGAVAAR
jgi:hypothetical protein